MKNPINTLADQVASEELKNKTLRKDFSKAQADIKRLQEEKKALLEENVRLDNSLQDVKDGINRFCTVCQLKSTQCCTSCLLRKTVDQFSVWETA